jgi:hypothetical protein
MKVQAFPSVLLVSCLGGSFPLPATNWRLQFKMRLLAAAIQTMIAAVETKNVEWPTH